MSFLSTLVAGMASDGADLIDDRGVPRDYSEEPGAPSNSS